jgi:hypothetical protein
MTGNSSYEYSSGTKSELVYKFEVWFCQLFTFKLLSF